MPLYGRKGSSGIDEWKYVFSSAAYANHSVE